MNTTSWTYAQSSSDVNPRSHIYRASTSPGAPHPLALMPGQVPQALDRPNLYFTNAARMSIANDVRNAQPSPPPVPLYSSHMATHFQPPHLVPTSIPPPPRPPLPPPLSHTHPFAHLHRSLTAPPPIPPKPFSAPPLPRDYGPSQIGVHSLPASMTQSPSLNSPTDEADIAMALALSESVSKEQQKTQRYLASQEEEDLARALEVSLLEARNPTPPYMLVRSASVRSSISKLSFAESSAFSYSLLNANAPVNDACDDEAFARQLAAEEKTRTAVVNQFSEAKHFLSHNAHASPAQCPHPAPYLEDDGTVTTPVASLGRIDSLPSRHSDRGEATTLSTLVSKSIPSISSTSFAISDTCDDEALARLLAAEEENPSGTFSANNASGVYYSKSVSPVAHIGLLEYGAVESKGVVENASCDDEAFARMLAAEEENYSGPPPATKASEAHHDVSPTPPDANPTLPQYSSREEFLDDGSPTSVTLTGHRITTDDDAHVRPRLLLNTPAQASADLPRFTSNELHVNGDYPSTTSKTSDPPQYSLRNHTGDTWSSRPKKPSTTHDEEHSFRPSPDEIFETAQLPPHNGEDVDASITVTNPPKHVTHANLAPPFYADSAGSSTSESSHPSEHPSVVATRAPSGSSEGMSSSYAISPSPSSSASSKDHSLMASASRPDTSSSTTAGGLAQITPMTSLSNHYGDHVDSNQMRPSPSAINLNAFVDKELFNGVSVGFMAPKISSQLVPMADDMPLVISLPYGKARPLHVQGPSWRHLLKLMAKLSGTRVEPALSAVAVTKTPPKLRTIIQFVKPHQTSTVWRTIFYFTIDYPSPQPDRLRSVNELPYSYSLAGVPTLLRDGADSPISKTYTIPASESVPYPTLPITFPELALYLQAALEESRRYLNDNSSGNRKLAKIIKMCYPAEDGPQEPAERTSVGGLFKRVIGRSNRSGRRGGNADTYELVTPFVQDEWG